MKTDNEQKQRSMMHLHHLSVIDQYWPLQRGCFGIWDAFFVAIVERLPV